MSTALADRLESHWGERPSLRSWFTTVDHKRIGRRYLVTAAVFFLVAGLNAAALRAQLAQPRENLLSRTSTTSCSPCTARR